MDNLPLVSVIVPVYNVEQYLPVCIESIQKQLYQNLEIVIVDDGSPDHAGSIADKYALSDKRITVIHKENGGVASARNTGMRASNGEFILFVDSDDWISEDHVEHLIKLQQWKDADMCMTTEFYMRKTDRQTKREAVQTISREAAAALLLSPKMVVGSYNKLYRRSWLLAHNIWQNEELFSGEGLHFIVTAAQHANYVTVSNRKIYYYRRNVSESATTKFNIKMYTNNELSLDLIDREKVVHSREFHSMLRLFRVHLKMSGLLAILTYASREQYPEEYRRWKHEIRTMGGSCLFDKNVDVKSKIRILCVIFIPGFWAELARRKRTRSFQESV